MKVAHNTQTKRAPLPVRLFRFWFPLFLFAYLIYAKLIALALPLHGPLAIIGRIVPVPVGITSTNQPIWYGELLKVEAWNKSLQGDMDVQDVRTWVELRESINQFAKEMNVNAPAFGLISNGEQDLKTLHETLKKTTEAAQKEGKYQDFVLERVEQIRSLIELDINFPDLAYQYSTLPSAPEKGVRTLLYDQLPESYKEAINKEEVALVQTDTHYVFVKIEQLKEDSGLAAQYKVTELGIAKQDLRETFYAYLLTHSVRWF